MEHLASQDITLPKPKNFEKIDSPWGLLVDYGLMYRYGALSFSIDDETID